MKILWWESVAEEHVPIFTEFCIEAKWKKEDDNWVCAREQLWAMREGLA